MKKGGNIIVDKNEMIAEKRQEYLAYIKEHTDNVKHAWGNMISIPEIQEFLSGFENSRQLIAITADNIKVHDQSKYSDEEFEPYRRHFHYIDEKEKEESEADFEKAWDHHKDNNMHHWNWWADHNQSDKMSIPFVLEMCCDWIAMSMKFQKNNAYEWYLDNKNEIILGVFQKSIMETILTIYYKYYDVAGNKIK